MESFSFLSSPKNPGDLGTLAHYRVIRELGRGGMGFVFAAEDNKLKRAVALKVMNQKISSAPGSRKRFISEARSMAAVHHDNVATIFEVGESGGTPFMAMEMLHGQTLEALNRSNKKNNQHLEFDEIIRYATEIARGLAAAHARGIVHRDIKPANIWLEQETQRIKILDFGLALASTPVDQLAGRGAVIGTPGYLSPEQARSDPLDDRSDLYSFGVVLYELCTGVLPIVSKSVPEQLISILAHRPKPIYELNPLIPRPLCDAIHRLIRKEPRTRYQSAKEFEESLVEVRQACEQSTEVAQAINKLKEGLSQVVEKVPAVAFAPTAVADETSVQVGVSGDPSFASLDEINVPVIDPFATDPLAASTPVGSGSGAMPSVAFGSRPRSPTAGKSPLQSYGPLIAVVAIALIALPIMTFAFTGIGRNKEAFVANTPQELAEFQARNPPPSRPSKTATTAPNPTRAPASGTDSLNPNAPQSNSNDLQSNSNPLQQKEEERQAAQEERERQKLAPRNSGKKNTTASAPMNSNDGSEATRTSVPSKTESNRPHSESPPDQQPAAPENKVSQPMSPTPEASSATSEADSSEAQIPRKSIWITTADGRGADAMVKKGSTENYGEKPALGVRRRGNIETNHIYLRFDLAGIEDRIETLQDVNLVMNVVGGKTPTGAHLLVYGIENVGLWPESRLEWRKSPSNQQAERGIAHLEPLAEVTIGENTSNGQRPGVVHISSKQLDEFLRRSHDTVTLAVTGDWSDKLVQFVSRDRSNGAPPRLKVSVSAQPPKKK